MVLISSVRGRTASFTSRDFPTEERKRFMVRWEVIDLINPADGPEEFPRVVVQTEAQLREELARLRLRQPAIIGLASSTGEGLQIGFGGPFAGIRWLKSTHSARGGAVLADRIYCDKRIDFAAEEDTIAFWPENLIPVESAIEVIVYFYKNHRLPDWIAWKEWDRESCQWIVKPATNARSA
jgi:hypothetical protein